MSDLKNAIIYLRASTDETRQGQSFDVQRAILSTFIHSHGYTLVKEFSEYASGRDDDRSEFCAAIEYSKAHNVTLITYRADRLSRSLTVFHKINDILPLIRFVELGDRTPDPLMLSVLFGLASNESRIIGLRVKAGMKQAKVRNPSIKFGNPNIRTTAIPAGLKVRVENARKFNARIKRLVSSLTKSGPATYNAIASMLNDFGITSRRGSRWNAANIRRVLLAV